MGTANPEKYARKYSREFHCLNFNTCQPEKRQGANGKPV